MIRSRKQELRQARKKRLRRKLRGTSQRPRLTVYKGHRNIQAQLVDDDAGKTLASASTFDKGLRSSTAKGWSVDAARQVGEEIAKRAKAVGVEMVVLDRNGFGYNRKIRELADAARKGGLKL